MLLSDALTEKAFQNKIVEDLVKYGGYTETTDKNYDRALCIDSETLIKFIKSTQEKQWDIFVKLKCKDEEKAKQYFIRELDKSIENQGLVHILRNGIKLNNCQFYVVKFKLENNINNDHIINYNKNIMHCIKEFHYSVSNTNNRIDIVLSINGIPVVAMELKHEMSGQDVNNAMVQWMTSRSYNEPCFELDRRFLVYFAMDTSLVYMTTHLKGEKTHFLPYNQGSNGSGNSGGAGNPISTDGEYTTSYLWKNILTKDSLLEILHKYVKSDKNEPKIDNQSKKIIFPRYHQLDCIRKITNDVRIHKQNKDYLIQHSAGSGKTLTITWLAHRLSNLHDENNELIFDSIIIVTDRTVVTSQLQESIFSIDTQLGVVENIDDNKNSNDLMKAIQDGKKIIVTTIQKFPYITEKIGNVSNKRFAIIIDEAHSSQNGEYARALGKTISNTTKAQEEYKEIFEEIDTNDLLLSEMMYNGKAGNVAYFAFTATPKRETLNKFGIKEIDKDGNTHFRAYHIYSMKQAIEELYIVDVLKNYRTIKTYFTLINKLNENKKVAASKVNKDIMKYVFNNNLTIEAKTEIIMHIYVNEVRTKLGGKGKAMLVTSGIEQAILYEQAIIKFIEDHKDDEKYREVCILIAFSGKKKLPDDNTEYTEVAINRELTGIQKFNENSVREEFTKDKYGILIVANKYQTGFDEKYLCGMFVDKHLTGINAVQTLSRLNRYVVGKETVIIDFQNKPEDIQDAFKPFFESTTLDKEIDENELRRTRDEIRKYKLYTDTDVDKAYEIIKAFEETGENKTKAKGSSAFNEIFKPIIDRYVNELDDDRRFGFKDATYKFVKWYKILSQISRLDFDTSLLKEKKMLDYLNRVLPRVRKEMSTIDVEAAIEIQSFDIKDSAKYENFSLIKEPIKEKDKHLENPDKIRIHDKDNELKEQTLEELLKKINNKYSSKGKVDTPIRNVYSALVDDKVLADAAKKGRGNFENKCKAKVKEQLKKDAEQYDSMRENRGLVNDIATAMIEALYNVMSQ